MDPSSIRFQPLLVACLLAFLIPLLFGRLRRRGVPTVILAIVAGVAVGRSGLGLIDPAAPGVGYLGFLSEFGFVFLMFVSGLEVDVHRILHHRAAGHGSVATNPLGGGLLHYAITLVLSGIAGLVMTRTGLVGRALPVTLILSTTAVGVVMPTLKQRQESDTAFGQRVILGAVVADLATLVLLTVMVLFHRGRDPLEAIFFGFLLVGFVVAYLAGRVLLARKGFFFRVLDELSHTVAQIKVRGALALMLAFVVLAEVVGAEVIIGSFLAGVILSTFTPTGVTDLKQKLEALGFGFFIPVFFIMVGVEFDVHALLDARMLVFVPAVVVTAFLVKLVPSLLLWTRIHGARASSAAGLLLSARLSLIIASSAICTRLGLITEGLNAAFILIAALTSIACPLAYGALRGRASRRLRRVIVAGAGRVGRGLAQRLALDGIDVTLVDREPAQFRKLENATVTTVTGDVRDAAVLAGLEPGSTDVFVAVTGTDETNRLACETIREHHGVSRLIARDNNPDNTQRFRLAGLIPMDPVSCSAIALENRILRPHVYELLLAGAGAEDRISFEVEHVNLDLDGAEVMSLPYKGEFLLISIRRDSELIIPHGHTRLAVGDVLLCMGTDEDRARLERLFAVAEEGTDAA